MPTLYTRMSQNRDMGHPFICGWSDVGHPPGLDLYGTMYIHGVRDSLSFAVTIFVSLISGGLSGACVNVLYNRLSRQRQLRTMFYPSVSDLYAAYTIRMQKPEGKCLVVAPDKLPACDDESFVRFRSSFICNLVQFNELDEARLLRTKMWESMSNSLWCKSRYLPERMERYPQE
jgi:hypothetical protein